MKCAIELITIKEVATKEWEMEEKMKDMKAKEEYESTCIETIAFCDTTLNKEFVDLALNREQLLVSKRIKISEDRIGNSVFRFIEWEGRNYADGTGSYRPMGKYYSLDAFIEYLNTNCFEVTLKDDSYNCYGCGANRCTRITIYVPKNK